MNVAELVFDVGDAVVGFGQIWDDADGVWFDPPHPFGLGFGGTRRRSQSAVRLVGCDPAMITTDRSGGGTGPGWASIQGEWLADRIRFTGMTPTSVLDHYGGRPQRVDPPCPAPPGGWPAGTEEDLHGLGGRAAMAGHVVDKTMYHPRPDSVVLAITTTDVDAVENEMRPVLGKRLCVVPSRWGTLQLDAVRQHLRAHWREWGVTSFGSDTDDRGQRSVTVVLLRVLPEMAEWAAGLPAGILTPDPALRPAGAPSSRSASGAGVRADCAS